MRPNLIIFASGAKDGGGSGFMNLVYASRRGLLRAKIVGVVSNHENGGVRQKADKLGVSFEHFARPWTTDRYRAIVAKYKANYTALSGWLKFVHGLDPRTTFNIHPAILPHTAGTYGHYAHELALRKFHNGEIPHSAITMHFVTDADPERKDESYDRGPIFFQFPIYIFDGYTTDRLAKSANDAEHLWQPMITNLVVTGKISWDGENPASLQVPGWYRHHMPF